ncbi:MAG: hypothetical protein V8R40_01600 [Dysosmobacter sp.]
MQLLDPAIRADLFTPERPIWAKGADKSSTYVGVGGYCVDSLVAEGCYRGQRWRTPSYSPAWW